MTNVPGAGFVALLVVIAVLIALPLLAGVGLAVAGTTGLRIELSLLAVHAVGIVGAVIALVVAAPLGPAPSLPAVVGLLRFTAGALAVGLAVAGIAEGGPIAAGAVLAVLAGDLTWRRGVWYATAGYAGGGVAGAAAGLVSTGRAEAAAAGAVLAVPAALCGVVLERAAARSERVSSTA
ncbi:hypothetical protein [Halobellus ruber]|uniref:Uncharacterized protein n=1 Tax=Halobellus ruber TaxID=2761102 RepID=A0A7J9SJ19_9EURY|nr:hypothetical protein [Halobellus ruber]MBB6645001.1 hypothetical protein [Halobellus ruber]